MYTPPWESRGLKIEHNFSAVGYNLPEKSTFFFFRQSKHSVIGPSQCHELLFKRIVLSMNIAEMLLS